MLNSIGERGAEVERHVVTDLPAKTARHTDSRAPRLDRPIADIHRAPRHAMGARLPGGNDVVEVMTMHRYEAHATIINGECELSVNGRLMQLVTLTLTDAGPITMPDGTDHQQPDVICHLRVCEARALAEQLLELADQASSRAVAR
jgi:hypothetical protein